MWKTYFCDCEVMASESVAVTVLEKDQQKIESPSGPVVPRWIQQHVLYAIWLNSKIKSHIWWPTNKSEGHREVLYEIRYSQLLLALTALSPSLYWNFSATLFTNWGRTISLSFLVSKMLERPHKLSLSSNQISLENRTSNRNFKFAGQNISFLER